MEPEESPRMPRPASLQKIWRKPADAEAGIPPEDLNKARGCRGRHPSRRFEESPRMSRPASLQKIWIQPRIRGRHPSRRFEESLRMPRSAFLQKIWRKPADAEAGIPPKDLKKARGCRGRHPSRRFEQNTWRASGPRAVSITFAAAPNARAPEWMAVYPT